MNNTKTTKRPQGDTGKRLSAQQVKELRVVVQSSLSRAHDLLLHVRRVANEKEVTFYETIIARNEALLVALPTHGGVEMDEPVEDQRHEPKKVNAKLWRCTCGSEFEDEDDADEHAANARGAPEE